MSVYEKFEDIIKDGKKYDIIYADPPWNFATYSDKGKGKSAEKHYNTMTPAAMAIEFPIAEICNKDAVLLMWTTPPTLPDGLELAKKLGFTYKTKAFCWTKENKKSTSDFFGMGYYTRANTEDCYLFTRGKPLKVLSKSVRQLYRSKIEQHSKKPDEIRDCIIALFGDRPRIELFSRQEVEGWDSFGNQVKRI